jgi:hypothetical protein
MNTSSLRWFITLSALTEHLHDHRKAETRHLLEVIHAMRRPIDKPIWYLPAATRLGTAGLSLGHDAAEVARDLLRFLDERMPKMIARYEEAGVEDAEAEALAAICFEFALAHPTHLQTPPTSRNEQTTWAT